MRPWLPGLLLFVLVLAGPAHAEHVANVRVDRSDVVYAVNADQSYSETVTVDRTLLTPRGIQMRDRSAITYYPDQQNLEVLEAWVDQPDGSRVQVGPDGRFTRPSSATQGAPGFTGSLTTTIVYPQLRPGSRTHIKLRRVQRTPPLLGFNAWSQGELVNPTLEDRMEIDLPTSVALHWRSRGAVTVTDDVDGDHRRIVAEIAPSPGQEPERSAVDASDYQPLFLATTLPDLAAVGATYYRLSQGRAVVTPAIARAAAKIVGERTGLDAARAIYDWVTANIRYIALTLNPNDGWVPHPAAEVMGAGYGDCKDHAVLMQALLAARGIVGEAALIQWGSRYADLPLGHPFEFNHVIVYLPDYDVWLNPTDPYAPFGSLDRALSGKRVVIATGTGRVARTPASTPSSYRYAIASQVAIDGDGNIAGTAGWTMSANVDASIRATLASASSPSDLMERLLLGTPEGGFGSFTTSDPRDLATPLEVSATWRSPHGVTLHGGEAAIAVPAGPDLEPALRLRRYLSADGTRRTPMLVGARELSWTTTISLPVGIVASRLPADVDVHTQAGRYTARYQHAGTKVEVSRSLVIDRDVFQPGEYPELERLLYAALDDARSTLTLTRAEAVAERPDAVEGARKE
jgi:transglutaminase-like putative cysteine protease